jgi:AcrR family transcriptional regulator
MAAAAKVFESDGFHGTDSNRIARLAGYAPGTFYKHFADKREIFLAVYDAWVEHEWQQIEAVAKGRDDRATRIERIVGFLVEHHRRSAGFRAALRVLVQVDSAVRRHHRKVRAQQVQRFEAFDRSYAEAGRAGLAMLFIERVCDALADDEAHTLGLKEEDAKRAMVACLLDPAGRLRTR